MKALISLLFAFFLNSTFASPVDGVIFYETSQNEVVERQVSFEAPSRGIGEVVLRGGNFEWRTTNFTTVKENGQVIFYAAFPTNFMNFQSTILFKGTYLNANNEIRYYGSFYKKDGTHVFTGDMTGYAYEGGFSFQYQK